MRLFFWVRRFAARSCDPKIALCVAAFFSLAWGLRTFEPATACAQAADEASPANAAATQSHAPAPSASQPSADNLATFRSERRLLVQHVQSKQPQQQVEALRRLRDFPYPDAAKLVLPRLRDTDSGVARTAYQTLLTYRDQPEIAPLLLNTLRKEGVSQVDSGYLALFTVLASSSLPQSSESLLRTFDETAGAHPSRWTRLTTMLAGLATEGGEPALAALQVFRQSQPFQLDFGFRRATVQAAIALRTTESVSRLIAWLEFLDGEARGDVIRYLTVLAGKDHGLDVKAWQSWWKEKQDGFEFPAVAAIVSADAPLTVEGQTPLLAESDSDKIAWGKTQFYGLPVYARRVVFLIDSSSSMLDANRMVNAKTQLLTAVNELDEAYLFNIVTFNQTVGSWQRQLIQATESSKKLAARYAASIPAQSATATYDGLEAALAHPNLEAIYLVTDGAPTAGKVINPDAIIRAVTEANRTRRVSLYVIGIQPDPQFESFLKTLAEQNFGTYRRMQ